MAELRYALHSPTGEIIGLYEKSSIVQMALRAELPLGSLVTDTRTGLRHPVEMLATPTPQAANWGDVVVGASSFVFAVFKSGAYGYVTTRVISEYQPMPLMALQVFGEFSLLCFAGLAVARSQRYGFIMMLALLVLISTTPSQNWLAYSRTGAYSPYSWVSDPAVTNLLTLCVGCYTAVRLFGGWGPPPKDAPH